MSFIQSCTYNPATEKVVPKGAIVLDLAEAPYADEASEDFSLWLRVLGQLDPAWDREREKFANWLADQIEAQTKPPRIPEPGLWGVVEAGHEHLEDGRRSQFVRVALTGRAQWVEREAEADWSTWDRLVDPVLIRDGIEDGAK